MAVLVAGAIAVLDAGACRGGWGTVPALAPATVRISWRVGRPVIRLGGGTVRRANRGPGLGCRNAVRPGGIRIRHGGRVGRKPAGRSQRIGRGKPAGGGERIQRSGAVGCRIRIGAAGLARARVCVLLAVRAGLAVRVGLIVRGRRRVRIRLRVLVRRSVRVLVAVVLRRAAMPSPGRGRWGGRLWALPVLLPIAGHLAPPVAAPTSSPAGWPVERSRSSAPCSSNAAAALSTLERRPLASLPVWRSASC